MDNKGKSRKGGRRVKGEGAIYSETKKFVTFTLTPSGIAHLNELADQYDLSRSEFVEQIARGVIPLSSGSPQPAPENEQASPEKDTPSLGKK